MTKKQRDAQFVCARAQEQGRKAPVWALELIRKDQENLKLYKLEVERQARLAHVKAMLPVKGYIKSGKKIQNLDHLPTRGALACFELKGPVKVTASKYDEMQAKTPVKGVTMFESLLKLNQLRMQENIARCQAFVKAKSNEKRKATRKANQLRKAKMKARAEYFVSVMDNPTLLSDAMMASKYQYRYVKELH